MEAARRAGAPDPRVPGITKAVRQQLQRWRRQRAFVILVAEDRLTGEVLGSAAVSLAQPEAALPPPFPTVKPRRAYVRHACSDACHCPACHSALRACRCAARALTASPSPLPSTPAPAAQVSNIAVRSGWRRHGVATALLQQCERQARLWRNDSLWLHVEVNNEAALLVRCRQAFLLLQAFVLLQACCGGCC